MDPTRPRSLEDRQKVFEKTKSRIFTGEEQTENVPVSPSDALQFGQHYNHGSDTTSGRSRQPLPSDPSQFTLNGPINYPPLTPLQRHDLGAYCTVGRSPKFNPKSHRHDGYWISTVPPSTGENETKHRKQKNTLSIVDPKTGKDVTTEIVKTGAKPAKHGVKKESDENKSIAAQLAALIKLYQPNVIPDSDEIFTERKATRNTQPHYGMLPKEILNMDSRSIELYNKALQEGEDSTHNIRLMIVGHYGVGKTTLTKRLFREKVDIKERKSTDGIDVHVGRCKVSLRDGTWLTNRKQTDGNRKLLLYRLAKLMCSTNEKEQEVQSVFKHEASKSDFNMTKAVENESSRENQRRKKSPLKTGSSETEETVPPKEFATHLASTSFVADDILHEQLDKADIEDTADTQNGDFVRKKTHLEELIKEVQHGSFINDDLHCDLSLWDFAGQNIFYATHQAFLSRKAVYLLVIDLSKHIDETVQDDIWHFDCQGEQHCKVAEFIEFWLNSIHEFCSFPGESGPPVILVGTFIDKLKQMSDADKCFYNLRSSLVRKVTNCHLTEKQFHIDNTVEGDENIEALRQYIVKVASAQSHWGERIPAKWITLEERLIRLKDEQNVKVIQRETLRKENKLLPVPIEKEEELELFLKFHHETGTILYFGDEDLRDEILLDPQWLIDAFKSLITAAMFCISTTEIQKKWHEFDQSAVLTQDLIVLIWTNEENSEYLTHKELILKFMETLGFVAKPKQCTDDESTKMEDYYLVPCMLKEAPPAKVIAWNDSLQFKSTSKLCLTNAEETDMRFIPATAFNRLISASINHWPLSRRNGKYMIFCGGAIFQLENNHFLYIFLYEHVIQIWISRLSMEGPNPSVSLCRTTQNQIRKILEENVRMHRRILSFVKCPQATLYSNDNMVKLEEDCIRNREIPCFCQDKEHVVSYVDIAKYWLPEGRIPRFEQALPMDLEKKPTEKEFSRISRRIGYEFKQVAFELGLSQPEIDHICMDNNTAVDKITAVFCRWSKRMGEKATYGELIKALQEAGVDVASVFGIYK